MRPFRFAVGATTAASADEWRAKARRAEELGYSALVMPDHLGPQLAPVPALVAAAAATTRLRVGSFVFANDYRNPVLLAKEAATIDWLTGGRLEFGIGAGWRMKDYTRLGIPYDPPRVRVERMSEATRLIKRLFVEEEVDFAGTYYAIRGARLAPRPLQRPHPPIMIGGGGPRILAVAAREADIVALAPRVDASGNHRISDLTPGATLKKIERLRTVGGARFEKLELNVFTADAQVTSARASLVEAAATRLKATVAGVFDSPYFLYGSAGEIRADLLARRERYGFSYYVIPDHAMEGFAPVVAELTGR